MRSKSQAAIQTGINSRGEKASGCGQPALLVPAVAGGERSRGMVGRAVDAIAPKFCSVCCEERRGLEPFSEQSKGTTSVTRTVWKCVDCAEAGSLADLAQCDIREQGASGRPAKSKGGGAR